MKNSGNNLQYSGNLENIFKIAVYNILHKKTMTHYIILIKFWAIYVRHMLLKTESFSNDLFFIKTSRSLFQLSFDYLLI